MKEIISPDVEPILKSVLEHAAFIGDFDPRTILAESNRQLSNAVLGALAEKCSEIDRGDSYLWRLKPDSRRAILRDLRDEDRLRSVAQTLADPGADTLGRYLRDTALGVPANASILSSNDLDELHTALQFIAPSVDSAISVDDVDSELAHREIDREIETARSVRLIGRESTLRKLDIFANSDQADFDSAGSTLPLFVSGVGGSGKSALLAEFASRCRRGGRRYATPLVWMDFDRATLAAVNGVEMLLEFSRQLALYRSQFRKCLSEFRRDVRRRLADFSDRTFEASASLDSEMWSVWTAHMQPHLPLTEPVILLFDTFEEVLLRDEAEVSYVRRWLEALQVEGQVRGLRTIVSGRARPTDWSRGAQVIELGPLRPASAAKLLAQYLLLRGKDPKAYDLKRLVLKFGGNPLLVKILSRYLADEGPESGDVLLSDADAPGLQRRFAESVLYRRILRRIRTDEPELEKLAHPGLVLRRVTADLIQRVLSEPCGLRRVDGERANVLLEKLKQQVWLVERTPNPDVVVHRRDLRRLMMRTMAENDRSRAQPIHERAAIYYAEHRDPHLSRLEQKLESAYHKILSGQRNPLGEAESRQLYKALGEDILDLPLHSRAQIKLSAGKALTDEEAGTLDVDDRAKYDATRTMLREIRGELSMASNSIEERPAYPEIEPSRPLYEKPDQYGDENVSAVFSKSDWPALQDLSEGVVRKFFRDVSTFKRPGRYVDFTESPIWKIALGALASQGSSAPKLEMVVRQAVESNLKRLEWGRSLNPSSKRSISVGMAVGSVLTLLGRSYPTVEDADFRMLIGAGFERMRPDIESNEQLRVNQLLGEYRRYSQARSDYLSIRVGLLCFLSSPVTSAIRASMSDRRSDFAEIESLLRAISDYPSGRIPSLSELQILRSEHAPILLPIGEDPNLLDDAATRSVTPELYAPLREMLRGFQVDTLVEMASFVQSSAIVWPRELTYDALPQALHRDRQRWTATLIEIADRCGLLGEMIDYCRNLLPEDPRFSGMGRLYQSYINILGAPSRRRL